MKKALIFTSLPLSHVGGIEKINGQIKDLLQQNDWKVDTHNYYELNVERLKKDISQGTSMIFYDYFLLAGIYDWQEYDLVITNDSVGGVCHEIGNTRVVSIAHAVFSVGFSLANNDLKESYLYKLGNFAESAAFKNKSQVIAVSKRVQNELESYHGVQSIVINNGFDFNLFLPSQENKFNLRKEYNIPDNAMVALYAGRWSVQEKRPDVTLALSKKFPEVYWIFATNDPLNDAQDMKNVIVLQNVAYEQMPSLYQEIDFTIQLSLYEGFSNFAIESIASKKPMISTRTGIIDEVYSHTDLEVLLIEQSDNKDVILKRAEEKVKLLLSSYASYEQASVLLRDEAEKRFSLKRWKEQMKDVLQV